jgi:hypothetical protein
MDSHAFASLAHVRILLLPVGSIRHSTFEKFAAEVRIFDDIRLGDIPADQKDERGGCTTWYSALLIYVFSFQLDSCPTLCPRDTSISASRHILLPLHILPYLSFARRTFLWE